MMKRIGLLSAVTAVVLSGVTKAETTVTTTAPVTQTAVAAPVPATSKPMASVDLRPSWTTKSGEIHNENTLLGGYQFSPKLSVYGVYNFMSNIYNPEKDLGFDQTSYDLSLRTKLPGLFTFRDTGIVFGYENRIYLPVTDGNRTAGMIATVRSYLSLSKSFGDFYKVTLVELPIFHIFKTAGVGASANPWYENRVYLVNSFQLTKSLSLAVPFYLYSKLGREFSAASNSEKWTHRIDIYPEITYAVNDNISVGLAYYSDNLITSDFGDTTISKGLEDGVVQFSVAASL